ncbi:MAG: alpha/beta fold hydrolase [Pleurocapsa sp.]
MPFINVSDYKVNYQAPQGIPESDSKPIMLLVHGAGGSSRHWLPMLSQLNADIFPVAVDLPGHGETSGTVPNSVTAVAEFLDSFLTAIKIKQPIYYVGHSLGGLIGLQFALNYPQRVKQLVVMATSAKIKLHPDFLASALSGEWDLATLRQSFAPEVPETSKNLVLNEFKHTRLDSAADDFMGVSEIDLSSAIASLSIPTLIITGADDVIISPRKGMLLLKQIPDARLVNIPGAGHYLQVEEPDKVAKEIEEFLLSALVGSSK